MVSLRTRWFREAEHRAAMLDRVFGEALAKARAAMGATGEDTDLNTTLRDELREVLGRDVAAAVGTVDQAASTQGTQAQRDVAAAPPSPSEPSPDATGPHASKMVKRFLEYREKIGTRHQVVGQERGTLRRFLEVAGDRPLKDYKRDDVTHFLDLLRDLPWTYGKSPKDKDKAILDLIADAESTDAERLTDKTVKRHLSALSQFFLFCVNNRGRLSVAERAELVEKHQFDLDGSARRQRAAWQPEELTKLFQSPIWTGRDPDYVTKPGEQIIRDAKFWLPLLALFQGARLEEIADLYRRDVDCVEGTWLLRIVETKEDKAADRKKRTLKTENAKRILPIHPDIIRLGFVDYVMNTAPNPDDPLFPDLAPQGKDQRRGPRFTRDFRYYREQVGVYRPGVGMHSFRHNANTRLRDAIKDWQQERHVAYLLGHSQGGGEGRERYDKGPDLKAAAATLALLRYPEIDLAHLYIHPVPEVLPADADQQEDPKPASIPLGCSDSTTADDLRAAVEAWFQRKLDRAYGLFRNGGGFFAAMIPDGMEEGAARAKDRDATRWDAEASLERLQEAFRLDDYGAGREGAREIATQLSISLPEDSHGFGMLSKLVMLLRGEIEEARIQWAEGRTGYRPEIEPASIAEVERALRVVLPQSSEKAPGDSTGGA